MKMKELLATKDRWCKIAFAKKEDGATLCHPTDEDAYCFCLMGAYQRCYGSNLEIMQRLEKACAPEGPTLWNDLAERTFKHVKKLLEELDI